MAMLEKTLTTCNQASQQATTSLKSEHSFDGASDLGLKGAEGFYTEHDLPCQVTVSANVGIAPPLPALQDTEQGIHLCDRPPL